jgi:hypothetical protein
MSMRDIVAVEANNSVPAVGGTITGVRTSREDTNAHELLRWHSSSGPLTMEKEENAVNKKKELP